VIARKLNQFEDVQASKARWNLDAPEFFSVTARSFLKQAIFFIISSFVASALGRIYFLGTIQKKLSIKLRNSPIRQH
jgi:hypothetical protein